MNLQKCHNIADLREKARRRLPRVMFDFLDGAAEDEAALRNNRESFNRYDLVPRTLTDVSDINLATTIQGFRSSLPLVLSPTGGTRLFHHDGDVASAMAGGEAGLIFTLSTMSTYSIEEVASRSSGPHWFQVYVWKDRGVVRELIERARAGGYTALCLTVDVQTSGQRERDLRNGFTMPPRFTLSSLFDIALHPQWWWHALSKPPMSFANVKNKAGMGMNSPTALGQWVASQLDPSVSFDDLAWMAREWGGPFLVKGIVSAEDAKRAVDCGATGIIVSNHGGRQLDHAIAPLDALPAVVEAVGDKAEVFLDGGIRRGTDIIKALALGATACMTGRCYLYGLAAAGKPGVSRAIELLRSELKRSMMLLGCTDVNELDRRYLRRRD